MKEDCRRTVNSQVLAAAYVSRWEPYTEVQHVTSKRIVTLKVNEVCIIAKNKFTKHVYFN